MREQRAGTLHQGAELAFFGVVTASLSHQINNVLTIISELNGLSEDLLVAGQTEELAHDRLQAATARIAENLQRAVEYVRTLNRFSHSADQQEATCDLTNLVVLLQAITQRFFELAKAQLIVNVPEREMVLSVRPFAMLHLLFRAVRAALLAAGRGGEVRLSLEDARDAVEVRLSAAGGQGEGGAADAELATLEAACRELGGTVVFGDERAALPIRILIPRNLPQPGEVEAR